MRHHVPCALLLVLASVLCALPARAADCPDAVHAWVARCGKQLGQPVELRFCPTRRVVLRLPRADLDVELRAGAGPAFRREGEIGISPVGEFPEWRQQPAARRDALEGVVRCVRDDPTADLFAKRASVARATSAPREPPPWRLIALGLAGALLGARVARRGGLRRAAAGAAVGLGALAALAWLRQRVLGFAFFHQNGHGPRWIDTALDRGELDSPYGPGFRELFAWAAHATGVAPEQGVFWWQALLGASIPLLAYCAARGVGAERWLALAVAIVLAVDPLLARLSLSESYFAAMMAFDFAAVAALTIAARRPSLRSPLLWLGILTAGLCIAQGARLHPLAWVPSALVPAVALLGPGSLAARVRVTVAAGVGIALVVGLVTGPALLEVLSGRIGQQWMPSAGLRVSNVSRPDFWPYVALLGIAALVLRRRRAIIAAAVAALGLAHAPLVDMLSAPNLAVDETTRRLAWPVVAPALAVLLACAPRRVQREQRRRLGHAVAALVVVVGGARALSGFGSLTELPTDALEQRFALEWRAELTPGAAVAWVERAEKRSLALPLHPPKHPVTPLPLSTERAPMDFSAQPGALYYYRSSLCSTEDGRAYCETLERALELELVAERELPARPSMRWSLYDASVVRVALFKRR